MEDSQIIDLYWNRDQQAIEETADKYGGLLTRISQNILRSPRDAEECVNDTYLRAWGAIPPTRPSALRTWLGSIVRNLSLDRWKQRQAGKRGGGLEVLMEELEDCVPAVRGPEDALEDQALAQVLSAFLAALPREGRIMFLRRYWYVEPVERIAARYGMKENTVKTSLFRTRRKLRTYLEKEGILL